MSRTGQCPRCRTFYAFNADDIGSVFACQCGLTLFVADQVGFEEIPVCCPQCDGEYVVDRDGAGEKIQCECGSKFTVPDLVLSQPISQRGSITPRRADTPRRLKRPTSTGTEPTRAVTPTADKPTVSIDHDSAGRITTSGDSMDGEDSTPIRRSRRWSPASVLGIGLVALFLLFSVGMFVLRRPGSSFATGDDSKDTAAVPAPIKNDDKPKVEIIDPTDTDSGDDDFPAFDAQANDLPNAELAKGMNGDPPIPMVFAAPQDKPFPTAKPARPLVDIPILPMRGMTFDAAYQQAFDSFTQTNELEKSDPGSQQYRESLGESIAMLQSSLAKIGTQQTKQQADEINTLLAFLYFRAGRLPEAAVLAEAAARWGDQKKDSTKETAMIGLAAMQEANQTQWGDPHQVGELGQMKTLIDVIAQRWPDDKRIDDMRISLAQSYERFGEHRAAAEIYQMIPESAPAYGAAQLAAGSASWVRYRQNPEVPQAKQIRNEARQGLSRGIKAMIAADKGLSAPVMSAKLNLARIELSAGDLTAAQGWLTKGPLPLKKSIGKKTTKRTVQMPSDFIRIVFETLFSIQFQRNDLEGAKNTLAEMSTKLGREHADQISRLQLSVATKYVKHLMASATVSRSQLSTLANLIAPLKQNDGVLTVANLLWLGESWATLAERTDDEILAKQCFQKAAAAYQMAMDHDEFAPSSIKAAQVRRLELLGKSGRSAESLAAMTSLLEQAPNAFSMQIQAAQTLQEMGEQTNQSHLFAAAVNGPSDSPIWGWNKLVRVLQSQPTNDETKAHDTERLMQCRYNLLWCHWQLAKRTTDKDAQSQKIAELRKMTIRMKTTIKPGVEPWFSRFEQLQSKIQ